MKSCKIIIGVDFGTTYSGVAWALSNSPEAIYIIKEWPAQSNLSSDKVPSEISYAAHDNDGNNFKWGFAARGDPKRFQWLKLNLDVDQKSPVDVPVLADQLASCVLEPEKKSPQELVSDYLCGLRRHIGLTLSSHFGTTFLEVTPVEYVFTVPAVWSDKAKALTFTAAERAGFGGKKNLRMISEPEAAALWSLQAIQPNSIHIDSNFVVVDCGGGTVDLISYKVVSLDPVLLMKEIAVGSGALCGSVYLNRRFESLIGSRVGVDRIAKLNPRSFEITRRIFEEQIKRSFTDSEDEDIFSIPLPGLTDDPKIGLEDGLLVLTRSDMRWIFDPIVNQIKSLVEEQILNVDAVERKKIKSILLVGGFGSNVYLRDQLQAWAKKRGGLEILQPIDAWTAIVRGAVIRGLHGSKVTRRISRRFYGVEYRSLFEHGKDPEEYKQFDNVDNNYYCTKKLQWFIKKGDEIQEYEPYAHSFSRSISSFRFQDPNSRKFVDNLLAYDGDTPPSYWDIQASVYRICGMEVDLSATPDFLWKKEKVSKKKKCRTFTYDLCLTIDSAELRFDSNALGKNYGTVKATFE